MLNLVRYNFRVSVWLSIFLGLLIYALPNLVFPDLQEQWQRNLCNLLIFPAFCQIYLWFYTYRGESCLAPLIMGAVYLGLLTIFDLQGYSAISGVHIPRSIYYGLLYIGLSHICHSISRPDLWRKLLLTQ